MPAYRFTLSVLLAVFAHLQTQAASLDTSGLKSCGETTAVGAIGGARFATPEGTIVKLALVKAPELWKKGDPYKSWPYAEEAKAALIAATKGQTLHLFCEGKEFNSQGEQVAHVIMPDGSWLQHAMVAKGHVFVFPRPTRRRGLDMLYAAEDEARAVRAGLWALRNLQPVPADSDVQTGWFNIVQGTVLSAQRVGSTIYLNFGADWRRDFTVEIPSTAETHFRKQDIDPLAFEGQFVEVRGWIDYKAGPRLLVQGPGQIRLKSQPAKSQ
ncbi:MAG: thermonuclease family protein [Alphaproteobacteria bacterium]|nr:thermonuclease family protein [Alphaproteobacteria bacterium]